jgi:hypothetical protein
MSPGGPQTTTGQGVSQRHMIRSLRLSPPDQTKSFLLIHVSVYYNYKTGRNSTNNKCFFNNKMLHKVRSLF